MLVEPRGSDYVIWLVALLLYMWDATCLLSPRQLLLVEASRRRLSVVFSESPFTIMGRVFACSPLLLPHRGVFIAPWGRAWADPTVLGSTLESVEHLRESLLVPRVLAMWSFVLLFIVGPLLTLLLGPSAAVVYTALAVYTTALAAVLALWMQRRELRLTGPQALWLSVDVLVCPAFLPNLVRKITATQPIDTDGVQVLFARAAAETREQLLTRLEKRTEDLLEGAIPDNPEQEELRSYVATVRAAQ